MIARIVDGFVELLKWPAALLSLLFLPVMIEALHYLNLANLKFWTFACGVGAYVALKIFASSQSSVTMRVLAHEFTHIFFALLTFHKVTHIHLNMDDSGGAMAFKGKGNWLIAIAPYFFPLFLFILIVLFTLFSDKLPNSLMINGILGYFFAYHVEAVVVQIHPKQTDFLCVGFPFCYMFLPGANLFFCSAVLAFNNGGWQSVEKYVYVLYKIAQIWYDKGLVYFTN